MGSTVALRCGLLVLPTGVLANLESTDLAYRLHLAAKLCHITLLSGSRATLAMASHSAANRKSFSEVLTGLSSLLFCPVCFTINLVGDRRRYR
jgi:hypothetical protein